MNLKQGPVHDGEWQVGGVSGVVELEKDDIQKLLFFDMSFFCKNYSLKRYVDSDKQFHVC